MIIAPYIAMHEMFKFFKRPVLTDLHNSLMLLYDNIIR